MELVEKQPASKGTFIYLFNALLVVGCCLTWFWVSQLSKQKNATQEALGPVLGERLAKDAKIDFYKRDESGVDQLMYPALKKMTDVNVAAAESLSASFFAKLMFSAVKATSHAGWVPFGKAEVTGANGAALTILIYTKPTGTAGYQIGDDWYEASRW